MSDRVQQILNSLRRDLADIGSPNEDFRPDECIGANAHLASAMDFEEKHFRNWIEYRFGVELSSGEANGVLDPPSNGASSANGLTWLRLAALINERLAHADFQPVEICGNRCATAGAFRSLERIARCLDPDCSRFAPSTPIFERLQGRGLERFLAQTRFLSGITLGAPVDLFQRFVAVVSYAVLAIIAFLLLVFAMSFVTAFWGWVPVTLFMIALTAYLACMPTVALLTLVGCLRPPHYVRLADGVVTFGDLARTIAVNTSQLRGIANHS